MVVDKDHFIPIVVLKDKVGHPVLSNDERRACKEAIEEINKAVRNGGPFSFLVEFTVVVE